MYLVAAEFTCKPGFMMQLATDKEVVPRHNSFKFSLTCQQSGEWDGDVPTCVPMACAVLKEPLSVRLSYIDQQGKEAICSSGFCPMGTVAGA